ncbi:hypothetical protein QYF36_004315 [Acer negundo]|nr:hypothetical protein QYF36_004315 [Acer negundo]
MLETLRFIGAKIRGRAHSQLHVTQIVNIAFLSTFGSGQTIGGQVVLVSGNCSLSDARSVADYLWNNFLGGQSNSRPLGEAVLDGIDFDIEQGEPQYAALARRSIVRGYLTVWVQFYNNPPCEYISSNPNKFKNSWNQWTSSIKAEKFYVGLPASCAAAGDGYVPTNVLISEVLPFVKSNSKYGGIMFWDKFNDDHSGYSFKVKNNV